MSTYNTFPITTKLDTQDTKTIINNLKQVSKHLTLLKKNATKLCQEFFMRDRRKQTLSVTMT